MKTSTFPQILKIQREQINDKERQMRYLANNVEALIEMMNQKVIRENAKIDFAKDPLHEVFRGESIESYVRQLVRHGAQAFNH